MLSTWQKIIQKIIKPAEKQDDSRSQNAASLPILRAELQIPQTIIDRYDASQHKNDTREWWRLVVDGGAFMFAVLGFYILYRTLVITQQTLETTREAVVAAQTEARAAVSAAEIAGKQLEISERPWITVTAPSSRPITFLRVGMHIIVKVISKNVGHSVAMDVQVDAKIDLFAPYDIDKPRPQRDRLCEESRRRAPSPPVEVVFPGHDLVSEHATSFPREYIEERAFTVGKSPIRFINPVVVGCVSYRSTFSATRHVTGFAYQISSLTSRSGYGYLRVDEPLSSKKIKFTPHFFTGVYID